MLSHLRVQNFRCLRDVTIDFAPLTVLIGKNDSGKTSILDAIRVLGETLSRPIPEVFAGPNHPEVLTWRRTREPIRWEINAGTRSNLFQYSLAVWPLLGFTESHVTDNDDLQDLLRKKVPSSIRDSVSGLAFNMNPRSWSDDDDDETQDEEFARDSLLAAMASLSRIPRHRFTPDALRRASQPAANATLSATGDNLTAVLDRIFSGVDSTRRTALERDLHAAIPTLRGLSLRTLGDSTKTIEYILAGAGKRPITIPCENASDGALLVTAYLALAYSDEPGTLLIEEPENGLHPSLLRLVFDVLRKISTGEYGLGPRQVIIATQSPLLLNYATKEEVRIVRRDLETGTSVTPLADVPDIDRLLREFAIGELWYHLGEDALVEGDGAATTERAE